MDFTYLGMVNRILMMGQQSPITSLETDANTWGYKAQLAVNDALNYISNTLKIKSRQILHTFQTVAGQRLYALPRGIQYPPITMKQSDSPSFISPMAAIDYDKLIPSDSSSDNPTYYYLEYFSPVKQQPALVGGVAGVLSLQPTASESFTVYISGYESPDEDSVYINESVLVYSSNVNTTNIYGLITSLKRTLSDNTLQVVDQSTNTILTLSGSEEHAEYPIIGLYPIPSKAITITIKAYAKTQQLVSASQSPEMLPESALYALITEAFSRFVQYDPKVDTESREALRKTSEREIMKLIADDARDNIQHMVNSPYYTMPRKTYFRPLERGIS